MWLSELIYVFAPRQYPSFTAKSKHFHTASTTRYPSLFIISRQKKAIEARSVRPIAVNRQKAKRKASSRHSPLVSMFIGRYVRAVAVTFSHRYCSSFVLSLETFATSLDRSVNNHLLTSSVASLSSPVFAVAATSFSALSSLSSSSSSFLFSSSSPSFCDSPFVLFSS